MAKSAGWRQCAGRAPPANYLNVSAEVLGRLAALQTPPGTSFVAASGHTAGGTDWPLCGHPLPPAVDVRLAALRTPPASVVTRGVGVHALDCVDWSLCDQSLPSCAEEVRLAALRTPPASSVTCTLQHFRKTRYGHCTLQSLSIRGRIGPCGPFGRGLFPRYALRDIGWGPA